MFLNNLEDYYFYFPNIIIINDIDTTVKVKNLVCPKVSVHVFIKWDSWLY